MDNEQMLQHMFNIRNWMLKRVNNDEQELTEEEVLDLIDEVIDTLEE